MPLKRLRVDDPDLSSSSQVAKRPRLLSSSPSQTTNLVTSRTGTDFLSPLSDEILIRILSYLSLSHLLCVAPVSRRFHRLSEDSQLWKALYYARFVLPRALRVPGFREGRIKDNKLHYKGRRTLWADGRLGGLVRQVEADEHPARRLPAFRDEEADNKHREDSVRWKRQFKIRHNWARGKCAVEELKLGPEPDGEPQVASEQRDPDRSKMLVKVVEGLAFTADGTWGLRAWDLKTKEVLAQVDLLDDNDAPDSTVPSCLSVDDHGVDQGSLDVSVGFVDGSFGIWRLNVEEKSIVKRYRHAKSSNGELAALSYVHPYLLTATGTVLVSLYTFDVPETPAHDNGEDGPPGYAHATPGTGAFSSLRGAQAGESSKLADAYLPAPYLMTSLKSHTSDPPLALSIRKTVGTTVASIAYTFYTRQGWSIGIQDLHITPNANPKLAPSTSTRLAYTNPLQSSGSDRRNSTLENEQALLATSSASPDAQPQPRVAAGPTTICYTHPYLLATLPDNTLILHLCTSNASALSISPGIRLWGHTSGISDAEITSRGKAVSVSSRGDEMRVWELEGRPTGLRSRSIEIRAGTNRGVPLLTKAGQDPAPDPQAKGGPADGMADWEERRNWVGFDDEMVIVLKEARGGTESLLVYDFT